MHKEIDKCVKIQYRGRLKNGNATLLLISGTVNRDQFLCLWEGSPSSSSIDRDEKGVLIHIILGFSPLLYYSQANETYSSTLKEKLNNNLKDKRNFQKWN